MCERLCEGERHTTLLETDSSVGVLRGVISKENKCKLKLSYTLTHTHTHTRFRLESGGRCGSDGSRAFIEVLSTEILKVFNPHVPPPPPHHTDVQLFIGFGLTAAALAACL